MVKKIIIGNELELTPENGYFLQAINGLGYKTRYSVNQILSRHGAKLGDAVFDHKQVRIALEVYGETPAGLLEKRNDLFKYLTINNYSTNDKIKFAFLLSNNQELYIEGVINDVDPALNVNTFVESPVSIILETEYPFLRSQKLYQVTVPIAIGGGASVPMAIPLDFTVGSSSSFTLVPNGGNVFSYPVIRLNGALEDPVLTDVLSGKSISFVIDMAEGEYLDIDTFNRTVIDEAGANKLDLMAGDFLVIPARDDNQFRLTTGDSEDTGHASIVYPYTYVAI